jgi:hypothetical protein
MPLQGPIFLAGIDRSGIGFLCELLEAHLNIAMTRRTNFWTFYLNRFGNLGCAENFERCLAEMMAFRRMQILRPDPDRLRREFEQGEKSYTRLFELLQTQRAERLGKTRWGDKSLDAESHADKIFAAYDHARMIHILRDPRDRCASVITHRGIERKEAVSVGTSHWLRSARLARRNALRYVDRYKIVRYESLVSDPKRTLDDVCTFVGENYSSAMLSVTSPASGRPDSASPSSRAQRRIWTSSVGRFNEILSTREVAFIQMFAAREMARWGYKSAPAALTGSEKVSFFLKDCPANIFRMCRSHGHRMLSLIAGSRRKPSLRKTGRTTWNPSPPPAMPDLNSEKI